LKKSRYHEDLKYSTIKAGIE